MKKKFLLLASAFSLAASLSAQPLYNEPYRPQYHYSPPRDFMNDPNGLVYFNGTYNLYFQYNPTGNVAGDQNWGHATSTDLIHWKNASPFIAIPSDPANNDFIYSGSAVVDFNNSSGFFNTAPGKEGLVAIYTLAIYPVKQQQEIAYSLDGGVTYTKYAGNPVLDLNAANFRDPYVFWYPITQRWIMAVSLANDHQILFYESRNLKKWNFLSSFGPAGTLGVAYEVPNLIHVPIEGTNEKKWVLLVGINPGAPLGGSSTQYFIGDFNGRRFKADDAVTRWMEFGKDAYAMETYNDLPTQDVIAITWVSNWQYTQQVPTSPWRGAQSVARFLTLRQTDEGLVLVQNPISLVSLHDIALFNGSAQVTDSSPLRISLQNNTSFEFETTLSANAQQKLNIDVRNSKGEKLTIGYDWGAQQLYVDRGATRGFVNPFFTNDFSTFIAPTSGQIKLHALVDRSILELYVNDGQRVATTVFYMEQPASELRLSAENGTVSIQNLSAYSMKSIWR